MNHRFPFFKNLVCLSVIVPLLSMCSTKRNLPATAETASRPDTSSTQTTIETLYFTVEEAPAWSALFHRTTGWFGGDGIFAIPLNGKDNQAASSDTETMLLFSDSMIGEIADSTLLPGAVMVHNTVAYLRGKEPNKENIHFQWATTHEGKPTSLFYPHLGLTPYGPFGAVIKVYEAKEMQHKNYITYNAKAHPHLSAPGELLISYNVNAFDFGKELKANPTLYRPRFIKLRLQQ